MASTAEELASQAEQLQSTIAFFKTNERNNPKPRNILTKSVSKAVHAKKLVTPKKAFVAVGHNTDGADLKLDDAFERY